MKFRPILEEERTGVGLGATHVAELTHEDLTESTADTDETEVMYAIGAGMSAEVLFAKVIKAFSDASDAAFNDTQISVGDEDDPNGWIAAFQVNENGTEVKIASADGAYALAGFMRDYAATKNLTILVESMAAKSLSNLDAGELHVYLRFMNNA